jgi:hypothetical protein
MGSCPRVKRPGREVYQSSPSSAEVKNEWSYTSTPGIRPHGVGKDKSTITLLPFHDSLSSASDNFITVNYTNYLYQQFGIPVSHTIRCLQQDYS